MNHGVFIPPFDELADPEAVLEVARATEDAGWDGLFLWDHVQREEVRPVADPWILMAAAAVVTEQIRIGPMVTPLVRRRPHKLAREVATLDHLSGGRLILGMGLGVDSARELSAYGEVVDARERGDMLDEGLALLRGLLSGEPVDHDGEHYKAERVQLLPTPLQERVPVWMAARTTAARPLRRAAGEDGLFIIEQGPPEIASMLEVVAAERGHLEGFDVAAVADPTADALDYARAGVTWWMESFWPGESLLDVLDAVRAGPPE